MKIRRKQVHEKRIKGTRPLWARIVGSVVNWPVAITAVFTVCASLIALYGHVALKYSIGQRVDQPVIARIGFSVSDPVKTAADKENARAMTPSHYALNTAHIGRIENELMRFYRAVKDSPTIEDFRKGAQPDWQIDEESYAAFRDLGGDEGPARFEIAVEQLKEKLHGEYIAEGQDSEERLPPSRVQHILVHAGTEGDDPPKNVDRSEVSSLRSDPHVDGRASSLSLGFPRGTREPIHGLLRKLLKQEPTITFRKEQTSSEMKRNAAKEAQARIEFEEGQYILMPRLAGEDAGLKSGEHELLVAERQAYRDSLETGTPAARAALQRERLQQAGVVTLVAFLSIALFVYVAQHQPRILENRARAAAFVTLVLGTLVAARALAAIEFLNAPELVLGPCLFTASVLAIVYPRRFSIGAVSIVGVMVGLTLRWDLMFVLTLLTGIVVSGFQLDDIRSRTKIVSAGLVAAVAVGLASFAGSMASQEGLRFAGVHAGWAAGSAVLAALVVSSALPFIEAAFGIATPLSLLEWTESRRPLLQLLANEAPGTHQHSLTVSKLADAACGAIGADGLLASAGALYHDIGKIPKAQYFAENQQAAINRHQDLAPTMSLLIIVAHVKDGIEMAKEYKLPRVLMQFIEEHHGTTVVRYFHHVASEKQPAIASGKHDREVPDTEFRYPGPKPRTRESAMVMLSDGVEGAVRALREPTPGRIEGVVHQIVMDRLKDGQFDNCDITLRQVRRAEESLVKTLCSLYHGRVAYPESSKTEESKREQERAGRRERKDAV